MEGKVTLGLLGTKMNLIERTLLRKAYQQETKIKMHTHPNTHTHTHTRTHTHSNTCTNKGFRLRKSLSPDVTFLVKHNIDP